MGYRDSIGTLLRVLYIPLRYYKENNSIQSNTLSFSLNDLTHNVAIVYAGLNKQLM